ncbi:hypothetical protein E2C01_008453 [Portunus trituberculatus]|uniref:Uncharacterized protein n=1 Tax=Portunus trituberculatus TaxID=210409 RepID=A0A5B7D418_PORTR|nr:hypothetical protein [Portunus trituberculatus]
MRDTRVINGARRRGGGEAACIKGPGNNLTRTIELGWPRIRRLKQRMRKNEDYDTLGLSGDLHDGLTLHSRSIVGMGSRNGGLLKASKTYTFTTQDAALMQIRRGRCTATFVFDFDRVKTRCISVPQKWRTVGTANFTALMRRFTAVEARGRPGSGGRKTVFLLLVPSPYGRDVCRPPLRKRPALPRPTPSRPANPLQLMPHPHSTLCYAPLLPRSLPPAAVPRLPCSGVIIKDDLYSCSPFVPDRPLPAVSSSTRLSGEEEEEE